MESVLILLEDMFEVPVAGLTVGVVVNELLDVDLSMEEDCLHLAISTPVVPSKKDVEDGKVSNKKLVVF